MTVRYTVRAVKSFRAILSKMYDPDLPFNMADTLRANLIGAYVPYADVLTCAPPSEATSFVYPGDRPVEGCAALSVSIDQVLPTVRGNIENVDDPSCAVVTMVDFKVRIQHCHKFRKDGSPLTPDEAASSSRCFNGLMWVTWAETIRMWRDRELLAPYVKDCSDITISALRAENPQGGMLHADMNVRSIVPLATLSS